MYEILEGPLIIVIADAKLVKANMCQTSRTLILARTANVKAEANPATITNVSSFLLSKTSAKAPEKMPMARIGMAWNNPVNPNWIADPDNSYTT